MAIASAVKLDLPSLSVFSLYEDRSGTLWAGTSAGVFQRPHGDPSFHLYDGSSRSVQSFAQDPAGALWITESRTIVRQLETNRPARPAARRPAAGTGFGTAVRPAWRPWVAGLGEGLFRITQPTQTRPPVVERFRDERLAAVAARSLFEDREKNLWVGMRGGGLLRLSESVIKTDLPLQGLTNDGVRAIASTPDGSVWVATGHRLNQFTGDRTRAVAVDGAIVLHTDRAGSLWVVTPRTVGRFVNGRLAPIAAPPGVNLERIISLTTDAQGALWLCNFDDGVLRWENGALTRFKRSHRQRPSPLQLSSHATHATGFGPASRRAAPPSTKTAGSTVYEQRDGLATGSVVDDL